MAVTNQKSGALDNLDASPPVIDHSFNNHGRLRVAYFSHTQDGVGDATSDIEAVRLPPGKVRVLGNLSNIEVSWATSSATMDVGWGAYSDLDGTAVAADPNGLDDGIDVDTANTETVIGSLVEAKTKVFESQDGVSIMLTSQDVALADGDIAEGYIIYVMD